MQYLSPNQNLDSPSDDVEGSWIVRIKSALCDSSDEEKDDVDVHIRGGVGDDWSLGTSKAAVEATLVACHLLS